MGKISKEMCPSWLKEHDWKSCKRVSVSRVRIPTSPPFLLIFFNLKDINTAAGKQVAKFQFAKALKVIYYISVMRIISSGIR